MQEILNVYHSFYIHPLQEPIFFGLFILVFLDSCLSILVNFGAEDKDGSIKLVLLRNSFLHIILIGIYPLLYYFGFETASNSILIMMAFAYISSILGRWIKLGGYVPPKLLEIIEKKTKELNE